MSQQGGRKRYANEVIEDDSRAKKPRKGESDVGESQNRENQGGDTSLPSSQAGPVTRSQTASQETPTDLTGGQPQDPASTGTGRVVLVPTPTRITRSTATACDLCYDAHRKVLASKDVANEKVSDGCWRHCERTKSLQKLRCKGKIVHFCETGKGGKEAGASSQRSKRSKRPDDSVARHFGARHMISRLEGSENQPKERPCLAYQVTIGEAGLPRWFSTVDSFHFTLCP
jgi:hypothetical protein